VTNASAVPIATSTAVPSQGKAPAQAAWIRTTLRWAMILTCLLVIGPLASMPLAQLRDTDGGHAVTMFLSGSMGASVVATGLVLVAATVAAAVSAWFFSAGNAFACSGLIVGWGAWRMGTIDEIVRRTRSGSDLSLLALENGLIVLCAAGIAWLISAIAERRQTQAHRHATGSAIGLLATDGNGQGSFRIAGMCLGAATLAAGLASVLVAATMSKGQTVFASFVGGLAAGVVAHLVSRGQNGNVSPALVALSALLPAALGPVIAQAMHGTKLVDATFAGSLMPLARIVSLEWACGLLLGIPVGLGWAGAMLDERSIESIPPPLS